MSTVVSRIPDRLPRPLAERLVRWELLLVALLVVVVLGNAWLTPYFLDPFNLLDTTFVFSAMGVSRFITSQEDFVARFWASI